MRGYPLHRVLAPGATLIGLATAPGRLLDLGRYPGLVAGRRQVRGELYCLTDPQLLARLDREEGYNFERRRTVATLADGRRRLAWVYRYRGPRQRAVPIPDGDYRRIRPVPARG